MTASDVDHKIVLNPAAWPKPSAKAHHVTHQRRNALSPLHSRSRSEPLELDMWLLIWSRKNNYRKEDKPNNGGVLWDFFKRTINITGYRNATDDVH
jgi:hypothetical protein